MRDKKKFSVIFNFLRLLFSGRVFFIYGGVRRRLLYYVRRQYCIDQLQKRKGRCSGAGHCCQNTIPWCDYFIKGRCNAYEKQPLFCKIFPLDEKDQRLSGVKEVCGYHFE